VIYVSEKTHYRAEAHVVIVFIRHGCHPELVEGIALPIDSKYFVDFSLNLEAKIYW